MQPQLNPSAIQQIAEKILTSIPELNTSDPSLTEYQKAETEFLIQVFRPICYYLATYNIPLPNPTLPNLIKTIINYNTGIDQPTRQTLLDTYVNPQTPIDWIAQSKQTRQPQNLFQTPSPDPLLRLSQATHESLPNAVRQHLALVFYFGEGM